jgi:hypothetical protein
MTQSATDKIKMMQASLRCFALGLLGLLPVIGLPFAIAAFWVSHGTRKRERDFWNPAKTYRLCGIACAAIGAVAWSVVDTFIVYQLLNAYITV